MKTRIITMLLLTALLTAAGAEAAGRCGKGKGRACDRGNGRGSCTTLTDAPDGRPSEAEAASLLAMREEEKLARDVYLTLGERWDVAVFRNIPRAEQRHMDRVGDLLERYGIDDPVVDDAVGAFADPAFAALYAELVEKGSRSLTDALAVGAEIEDLDLADLYAALDDVVERSDIAMVYENLARGSRNHMRAFAGALSGEGATYEARHITADELASILASDHERGGGRGRGGRGGKGRGRNGGC